MNTSIKNKIKIMLRESQGCVLCRMTDAYEFSVLSIVQYQVGNDDDNIKEQISNEGGFCDFHFKQFKKIVNGNTKLLLVYSLTKNNILNNQTPKINCRICKRVDEYESSLISTEIELLKDDSFRIEYAQSFGLCFPHMQRIVEMSSDEKIRKWIKDTNKNQMIKDESILKEMIKVNSYNSLTKENKQFINLIIEKFTGRKSN